MWPIEERRVPPSEIPGEAAWPTQPFPTAPPPFAPQRLTAEDINPYILTPDERETWKTRIANARNEGLFTPPALKDTVSIPGAQGGANWGCTAADPAKGIVYVLSINVPSIYKLSTEAPGAWRRRQSRRTRADRAGCRDFTNKNARPATVRT